MAYVFEMEMMVRDYECDLQGIVNNAVVTRIEMDYKLPLRPRDRFTVKLAMRKQGRIRFVFHQAIFRKPDGRLVLEAQVHTVLTRAGRPIAPTLFDRGFAAEE